MGLVPEIAAARGKILTSLASRVGQVAKAPPVSPLPTAGYRGPDGELLRLQDEVLELTLRSLSPKPAGGKSDAKDAKKDMEKKP